MMRFAGSFLCVLMLAPTPSAQALDHGGGSGGGGDPRLRCQLRCYLTHGSCTTPSGDPTIPPLKDPFCAEQRAACLAACPSSGGGSGFIGRIAPAPSPLVSPLHAPTCDTGETTEQG